LLLAASRVAGTLATTFSMASASVPANGATADKSAIDDLPTAADGRVAHA